MLRSLAVGLVLGALAQAAQSDEYFEYEVNSYAVPFWGYWSDDLSFPDKMRPGVLVIHDRWGQDRFIRRRATALAAMGYCVLAVDMYGNGLEAYRPEIADKLAGDLLKYPALAQKRIESAIEVLTKHYNKKVDPERIAAIGYGFGGTVVLEMARLGLPLKGVASFYGDLENSQPAKTDAIATPILVLTGAADPLAPTDQIEGFRKEMDAAGAKYEIIVYPGAMHGFSDPKATALGKKFSLPLAYDEQADEASWAALTRFLNETLQLGAAGE